LREFVGNPAYFGTVKQPRAKEPATEIAGATTAMAAARMDAMDALIGRWVVGSPAYFVRGFVKVSRLPFGILREFETEKLMISRGQLEYEAIR
jgi:hypothetical protein